MVNFSSLSLVDVLSLLIGSGALGTWTWLVWQHYKTLMRHERAIFGDEEISEHPGVLERTTENREKISMNATDIERNASDIQRHTKRIQQETERIEQVARDADGVNEDEI